MTAGVLLPLYNFPLIFCNLYKNLQIRVKKIRRPLWLCVNCFKKWPHVPLIRCSLKPIKLQRDLKQRCYLRKKHKRNCNINKERYHVSVHAAHMYWVGFFFIQKVCILLFHVAEQSILLVVVRHLFVGGLICHTYVIFHDVTWRVFVTEATPLALEMVQSKAQHNCHKVGCPILLCKPTSALYCIVTHFMEMIVCL